ncbi:hypothetical protein D9758_011718 [Tetrapyrgos nigripes]|uniref:BTB domain-containing protein n=1 Tax=Tetrapyrgos nigripes TaxID=182062 RepID=A0A8H5LMQ2_9AGAR|nr:hypothetical protein D9758_011718 [Tetrapyrgos nigripes]
MSNEQLSSTDECLPSTRVSTCFNHPTSDVILQSSDRVLFKVHRRNLEMHSQVFADAAGVTSTLTHVAHATSHLDTSTSTSTSSNEVVHLSESSSVLELMLQYMYLQPQPDLRKVDFEVIKDLAEAVEKYVVYSAMAVLNAKMREHIPTHPIPALLYAIRHGYTELVTESAEATLDFPPYTMLQKVPSEVFSAWISYQQTYHILLSKEFTRFGPTRYHASPTNVKEPCKSWAEHYSLITTVLGGAFAYSTTNGGNGGSSSGWSRMRAGSLAGLGGPSRRWAAINNTSSSSSPSGTNSPSTTLFRFFATLERRLLLSGSGSDIGIGTGVGTDAVSTHGGCADCKRELGHWLQQAERDWREWREGRGVEGLRSICRLLGVV